jgi:hypothetical protein
MEIMFYICPELKIDIMKIRIEVTQNYYKSTNIDVEIPSHITMDGIMDYLYALNDKTNEFQDELSNASLNLASDMDIDNYEILD